jgi:ABC-2 type transport system permease protein
MEATMLRLFLQELRFRRNAIIGWGVGLCFFPIVYVGLYPSFAEQMAGFEDLMDMAFYQALGFTMATFEDYLASTITNLVPIIISVYALINGTGTLAGEEESGRLEMIVALPIPRWQIVTVKAAALAIALLLIVAIVGAGTALTLAYIQSEVETEVTPAGVFVSVLAAWPLILAFGMISLFLGAFSASRRAAAMLATIVVIVSYLGNNLTGLITSLESIEWLFVNNYFEATADAIRNGQQTGNVLVLLGISLVAFLLAIFFFQRRNVTVGAWPWQRGRVPRTA